MKKYLVLSLLSLSACSLTDIKTGVEIAREIQQSLKPVATATPTPIITAPPILPDPPRIPVISSKEEPVTVPGAGVDYVLFKPQSDTVPKVAVLSIAADFINRYDLEVAIFVKGKEIFRGKTYSDHRGNHLPQHKYGRFNIKLGKVGSSFPKNLELRFYSQGKRVNVGGLTSFKVSDPSKRWVIENGRVRLDPK